MSITQSNRESFSPYIRVPALYSLASGLRNTPSVRSWTDGLVGSRRPAYISMTPNGWVSSSSISPSSRTRQNPSSEARGWTFSPASLSSQV